MLLAEVERTSAAVADAPGRLAKVDLIARLLQEVPGDEITVATSFLSGDLTQRQIGVGYAALSDLTGGFGQAPGDGQRPEPADGQPPEPAATPQLTLTDTDRVLGQIGQLAALAHRPSDGYCWPACWRARRHRNGSSWSGCWPASCARARSTA